MSHYDIIRNSETSSLGKPLLQKWTKGRARDPPYIHAVFGQELDRSGRTDLCGLLHSALCACVNKHPRNTSDCQKGGQRWGVFCCFVPGGKMQFVNRLHQYVHLEWKSITNTLILWVDGTCKFQLQNKASNIHQHRS